MKNFVGALLIATFISAGIMEWRGREAQAATPANVPDVECYPWADAEGWTVTRCHDYNNGESCVIASSGFMACRMGD